MTTTALDQIYELRIKPLPRAARLQLLARIAQDLASDIEEKRERSIMELHGLGAEIWQGVDAQEYVNDMRDAFQMPQRLEDMES
jgi:hypothetical protein